MVTVKFFINLHFIKEQNKCFSVKNYIKQHIIFRTLNPENCRL
jgi:hypothetical protein